MNKPVSFLFQLHRSTTNSQTLSSGNEMINSNDRLHYAIKSGISKHLRTLATYQGKTVINKSKYKVPLFTKQTPCYMLVYISPPTNMRMDAPNWYPTVKPLLDGLVDAGILEDDNNQIITSLTFLPSSKSKSKKYEITLQFYQGELNITTEEGFNA